MKYTSFKSARYVVNQGTKLATVEDAQGAANALLLKAAVRAALAAALKAGSLLPPPKAPLKQFQLTETDQPLKEADREGGAKSEDIGEARALLNVSKSVAGARAGAGVEFENKAEHEDVGNKAAPVHGTQEA